MSCLTSFDLTIHIIQQLFGRFCLSVTDCDGDIMPGEILDGCIVKGFYRRTTLQVLSGHLGVGHGFGIQLLGVSADHVEYGRTS